jgi:alkyl sulfatase BDS1-like metallo-beta-lactamase superfamily hydrolase
MSSNPNKRNYFLSEAQILRDGENQSLDVKPKASMLEEVPIDMFFEVLSVRLNPKKVKASEVINACFTFSSGTRKVITIRNQIAQITNQIPENCNLKINSSEAMLKQVLAGLRNPVTAIASQDIMVDKNVEFIKFLSRFTP